MAADGNVAETATACFIHKNTLRYRLKRLTEILGRDPAEPDAKFQLRMAFDLVELFRGLGTDLGWWKAVGDALHRRRHPARRRLVVAVRRWQGAGRRRQQPRPGRVDRRALADAGSRPVDELVLGSTVPQQDAFYGAPTLAARLAAPASAGR